MPEVPNLVNLTEVLWLSLANGFEKDVPDEAINHLKQAYLICNAKLTGGSSNG